MNTIKGFDSFNEKKKEWIKDAIKKPGALKKQLGKDEDEKLTKKEIEKEIDKLEKKDKDPKKPGTQLGKKDATKKKRLELAKTLKKMNEHAEQQNYMFFGNLKTIKRLVDEMLEMDEPEVDRILSDGHNWALDHIATSKDDVEEVFNFLAGHNDPGHNSPEAHEERPIIGGPESSHSAHDATAPNFRGKREDGVKGFEDFQ